MKGKNASLIKHQASVDTSHEQKMCSGCHSPFPRGNPPFRISACVLPTLLSEMDIDAELDECVLTLVLDSVAAASGPPSFPKDRSCVNCRSMHAAFRLCPGVDTLAGQGLTRREF